jgi:D-alanine transaminase
MGEPLPVCFLNDDFLPLREARISPLDRGFLYSDGAYEVTPA